MNLSDLAYHPGVTIGMPFSDYLAIDACSATALKRLSVSPLNYKWLKENEKKATRSLSQGTAAHCAILEPHRLKTDFVLWTGGVRRGKAWDLFEEAHAGKQILNEQEWSEVQAMHAAAHSHPDAARYFQHGFAEVTLQWTDPQTGRKYKARVDWVTMVDDRLIFVDLKTTRDSSPRRFGQDAFKLGYHIQAALYVDGGFAIFGDQPRFVFVAVENKGPFDVSVFNTPDHILEQGHDEYTRLEETLAACEASGFWPGRSGREMDLSLPAWAYDTEDEDLTDLDLIP